MLNRLAILNIEYNKDVTTFPNYTDQLWIGCVKERSACMWRILELGLVIAGPVGAIAGFAVFIRKTNRIKRTTKAVLHNDAGRLSA